MTCPPVPDAGGCACGRERCAGNYGWDGMHPALRIGEEDLMPDTQAEVYAVCRKNSLVAMDAGDGSREDFADWVNAGFVVRR